MLRTLLIHGARTVIRWANKYDHAQSRWIKQLVARAGTNKATVALANKMTRMIWAVLTQGTTFDMHKPIDHNRRDEQLAIPKRLTSIA